MFSILCRRCCIEHSCEQQIAQTATQETQRGTLHNRGVAPSSRIGRRQGRLRSKERSRGCSTSSRGGYRQNSAANYEGGRLIVFDTFSFDVFPSCIIVLLDRIHLSLPTCVYQFVIHNRLHILHRWHRPRTTPRTPEERVAMTMLSEVFGSCHRCPIPLSSAQ